MYGFLNLLETKLCVLPKLCYLQKQIRKDDQKLFEIHNLRFGGKTSRLKTKMCDFVKFEV